MAARLKKPHVVVEVENGEVSDDSICIDEEDETSGSEDQDADEEDEESSDMGSDGDEEDQKASDMGSDGDEEDQKASDMGSDGDEEDQKASDMGSDGDEEDQEASVVGSDGDEEDPNPNAGWAEAMAKILGKKVPESKPIILVKNKELDKIKEKEKKERLEKKKQFDKKRTWENMCREKPDVVRDKDHERNLQRIATRGVVQLFNAVKKHQKNVDDKMKDVGGSVRKKAKILSSVSKKDFIDVLRAADGVHRPAIKKEVPVEVKEEHPSWSVLRDDFMMGASMKDWDKESDEGGGEQEPAEDYSSDSE
ncbi:RRP15-like protein isoform X2 [Triplophysa rosa]|uniref:RRP15-like protein isoform X2 n=1 Tax=Triplophysa rosa TaxID=992332 RepID=UPI002545F39F|nr:RRP15-like protein isoform X2 [Triplophysa rosa]